MKKILFVALAAMTFVACTKNDEEMSPSEKGEKEKSYVAITLAAGDLHTRAAGDEYDEGLDAERAVKSAYVFFFKDGAAFPVSYDAEDTPNARQKNFLQAELKGEGEGTTNVSDVKDAILILENYQGEYPNEIVAVLNWTPTESMYTLSGLKTAISDLGDDTNGYVMSNAVYANGNQETIDAVDLTIANIGKTADEALANPVEIYVERVAAKVVFTADNGGKFEVGEVNGESVYAQITGFELFNDTEQSWLIKRINPEWTNLGFNWNEPDWFRSYWAESLDKTYFGKENNFKWDTDNTPLNGHVYCGENTIAWTADNDLRTKVIVKALLVNSANKAVEVANWYGKDYVGEENLKKVVANTIYNTYFYSTDGGINFTGLEPEDIRCVARDVTDPKAYEVYFQLSTEANKGVNKVWYKYENGSYTKYADNAALDAELANIQPALLYKEGQTYYFTDIKHLGAPGKTAEYGVVRNHVYKVNISDITGYGTPVYNGDTGFVTPEKPEDVRTYVSAQISILSWRVVDYDYPL